MVEHRHVAVLVIALAMLGGVTAVAPKPLAYLTQGIAFAVLGGSFGVLASRLRRRAEQTRVILESAHEGFISMDAAGAITEWNPAAAKMFGWSREEVLGRRVGDTIVPPAIRQAHEEGLKRYMATGEGPVLNQRLELSAQRRDGSAFPVELTIAPARQNSHVSFHAFLRDISERERAESEREQLLAKLEAMTRADELTGLANRRAWEEEIRREIARANRTGQPVCMAMLDLDRFKQFNDRHGHAAGDRLLRQASAAWRTMLREGDFVARLGGEEFAFILPNCALNEARQVVERLRAAPPEGQTCSAGVACFNGAESPEALLRRADLALYEAKRAGRDCVVLSTAGSPESP